MHSNTLILGIGNTLLSDEGLGVHMLEYLRIHHPEINNITLLDGGTLSFTLASWFDDGQNMIVIDAAELHAEPGTIKVFEGDAMDRFAGKTKRSVHEVSLGDLLWISHLTESLPVNRALIAIQPQELDWGCDMSPAVSSALPQAAEIIIEILNKWSADSTIYSTNHPVNAEISAI